MGHWNSLCGFDPEAFGFIYKITMKDGRWYIGQKHMVKTIKRPPLKGKKRKRICKVESDWKSYVSSSNIIKEDIDANGKDGYKFEILRMAYSKFELTYLETKLQFDLNVLFDKTCLNGIINCRIGTVPKELQERFDRTGLV